MTGIFRMHARQTRGKKAYGQIPDSHGLQGRPRKHWQDDVEEELSGDVVEDGRNVHMTEITGVRLSSVAFQDKFAELALNIYQSGTFGNVRIL